MKDEVARDTIKQLIDELVRMGHIGGPNVKKIQDTLDEDNS